MPAANKKQLRQPKRLAKKATKAAPTRAANAVTKSAKKQLGKGASWLDVKGKALKTAAKADRRRGRGRPAGAKAFAFKLTNGERLIEMKTFVSRDQMMRVSMPPALKAELKKATGGRMFTAALPALAAWALAELKRKNRTLVVDRDDRESREPPHPKAPRRRVKRS